jgi:hypothetical protein
VAAQESSLATIQRWQQRVALENRSQMQSTHISHRSMLR